MGMASRGNFSDANRFIVEQTISYFTVNRCAIAFIQLSSPFEQTSDYSAVAVNTQFWYSR